MNKHRYLNTDPAPSLNVNRPQLTVVIGTAVLLVLLSINLAVQDRERADALSKQPDPKAFHSARRIPPEKAGGERILEVVSPGKVFRIPADLILMGPVPTTSFSLRLIWPEWEPLKTAGSGRVKDIIDVHVRLDPKRGQRTGRDRIALSLEPGHILPPIRLAAYPDYLIYPQKSYRDSGNVGWAFYQSDRPDGITPEGEPILFRCAPGKGKDSQDWTLCRGYYRIFDDLLITVDFFGEHIEDGTDIYVKSMELIRSLVEVQP